MIPAKGESLSTYRQPIAVSCGADREFGNPKNTSVEGKASASTAKHALKCPLRRSDGAVAISQICQPVTGPRRALSGTGNAAHIAMSWPLRRNSAILAGCNSMYFHK